MYARSRYERGSPMSATNLNNPAPQTVVPAFRRAARKFAAVDLTRWKREINPSLIAGTRIELQRENAEWVGCCPFHEKRVGHLDKTPSFKIYKGDSGIWLMKCFGCGISLNIFQFVQQYDEITFQAAVEKVLIEAGVAGWQDG